MKASYLCQAVGDATGTRSQEVIMVKADAD